MKFTVAMTATCATVMALKQQRLTFGPEEVPVEAAWGHRSVVSTVHGLTLLLALAAISTMAIGLGMFYYQVVSDAEALLKTRTRKFGDSNAEGACCDATYGGALLDPSQAKFKGKLKDCVNNGLTQPRTILVAA
ncbi:unnamed protein product [Cladocopium goreaui]|uniref:Uncharacterized protein n=1 Tax=Cladocopium goreaui TaxID=2562237 RepID=A0A9P1DV83_9DINO|nr:unnamed protein product [Cladocopium goreaui]|mmetsp:Transcript_41874/g.90766  ORF Transcript_41874/g.90766 Transcript_41874/m.90766 type:complete len:134 (+) Transcript_41874:59-460(+)